MPAGRWRWPIGVLVVLVVSPVPAAAGTVSLTSVEGAPQVRFTGGVGEDWIEFDLSGGVYATVIPDPFDSEPAEPLVAGDGCTGNASASQVFCPIRDFPAGPLILATLGGGDDRVHAGSFGFRVDVDAGAGNDFVEVYNGSIRGGGGSDYLLGGNELRGEAGNDRLLVSDEQYVYVIDGGAGNDTIERARRSDPRVRCGPGNDKLENVRARIGDDCETHALTVATGETGNDGLPATESYTVPAQLRLRHGAIRAGRVRAGSAGTFKARLGLGGIEGFATGAFSPDRLQLRVSRRGSRARIPQRSDGELFIYNLSDFESVILPVRLRR